MGNEQIKITPQSLPLRVNTRSLKNLSLSSSSLDGSNPPDWLVRHYRSRILIREKLNDVHT